MDANRFDTLTRSLTGTGSRRRALITVLGGIVGTLGLAPFDDAAAGGACKPACTECQTCKKGDCRKTKHGKKCTKGRCQAKDEGTGCSAGSCQGGNCVAPSPTCPPTCPTCQVCNAATGLCVVQPTGQAGQACAAPKVCCSGACCDPIHECNSAGACVTCAEACDFGCACYNLADGNTICRGTINSTCAPCTADSNCTSPERCVTSFTSRNTNQTQGICGGPVGSGFCATLGTC